MSTSEHVAQLLGVQDCSLDASEVTVVKGQKIQTFSLSYCGKVPKVCPVCGSPMRSHGSRTIVVVSTPHLGTSTKLKISFPRLRCSSCSNIWRPEIGGVDETHRMTDAAYADIAQKSLRLTFREVAEEYPLSHVTVKNVFENYVKEHEKLLRFKVPAFLGIDEKHLKRVGMVTVITDLENRTVFDLLPGRKQTDLDEYFSKLEGLERVQWVSSDMYRPFWKSLGKHTPNATWVIDHFHVVKGANEALDTVRKSLQGVLDKKGRLEFKKGLAYALRKRPRDLSASEASALRELRGDKKYAVLMDAYDLKEDFFNIYDEHPNSREDAEEAFEAWLKSIPEDEPFDPFRALAQTVENHREYIFNYWECPSRISNGYTECANRLIKETDMKGRGYSFATLRARTLYRKQNLDRIIASNGLSIGPRIDQRGPLFVTEPVSDVDEDNDFNAEDAKD
mgnify:FL=1